MAWEKEPRWSTDPHNSRFMKDLHGDPKKAQEMQICSYECFWS